MAHNIYNDGKLTRTLLLLLFRIMSSRIMRRCFPQPNSIVFVTPSVCVKSTSFTTLAEAEAMRFVSASSTVPVPKVYMAFEHDRIVYIVMERIRGQPLSVGWVQRSPASKEAILSQLRHMTQEIRQIRAPKGAGISNVCGGPIFDHRLPGRSSWGPFSSIRDFHRELRNGIELENIKQDGSDISHALSKLISFHDQLWEEPVFTHGDLSSLNILAQGDKIVGIIDWETAGWMPPYWEYTSAWHVNPQNQFWQQEVDRFLDRPEQALEMETIRKKYFGDF